MAGVGSTTGYRVASGDTRWIAVARCALLVAVSLACVLAAGLAARRLTGHLPPLAPATPWGIAAVLLAAVTAWRGLYLLMGRAEPRAAWWLPFLVVVAVGFATTEPRPSRWGAAGVWALLLGTEGLWCWWLWPPRRGSATSTSRATVPEHGGQSSDLDEELVPPADETVTQRLVRAVEEGHETLWGEFRCCFQAGERTQSLHVAFCPPLAGTPELHVEQLSGPEAQIRIVQQQSYGVRLDLRLVAATLTADVVTIRLLAQAARIAGS